MRSHPRQDAACPLLSRGAVASKERSHDRLLRCHFEVITLARRETWWAAAGVRPRGREAARRTGGGRLCLRLPRTARTLIGRPGATVCAQLRCYMSCHAIAPSRMAMMSRSHFVCVRPGLLLLSGVRPQPSCGCMPSLSLATPKVPLSPEGVLVYGWSTAFTNVPHPPSDCPDSDRAFWSNIAHSGSYRISRPRACG